MDSLLIRILVIIALIGMNTIRSYYALFVGARAEKFTINNRENSKLTLLPNISISLCAIIAIIYIINPKWLFPSTIRFQIPFAFTIQIIGIIIIWLSAILLSWTHFTLGKLWTVNLGLKKEHWIINKGPYRLIRHPMYLSFVMLEFGILFVSQNILALLPIFSSIGFYKLSITEEKLMLNTFGDEYLNYQQKTGRFLPKFYNN